MWLDEDGEGDQREISEGVDQDELGILLGAAGSVSSRCEIVDHDGGERGEAVVVFILGEIEVSKDMRLEVACGLGLGRSSMWSVDHLDGGRGRRQDDICSGSEGRRGARAQNPEPEGQRDF